jgi:hypothetical protein
MQSGKRIQTTEFDRPSGDRHSIARQVFGSFISAMRQSSEMQTMVSRYHRD